MNKHSSIAAVAGAIVVVCAILSLNRCAMQEQDIRAELAAKGMSGAEIACAMARGDSLRECLIAGAVKRGLSTEGGKVQ